MCPRMNSIIREVSYNIPSDNFFREIHAAPVEPHQTDLPARPGRLHTCFKIGSCPYNQGDGVVCFGPCRTLWAAGEAAEAEDYAAERCFDGGEQHRQVSLHQGESAAGAEPPQTGRDADEQRDTKDH